MTADPYGGSIPMDPVDVTPVPSPRPPTITPTPPTTDIVIPSPAPASTADSADSITKSLTDLIATSSSYNSFNNTKDPDCKII